MGFYAPAQLVQDARRHGVEVRAPDVQASDWDCTLEGGALRLGLRMVSGLSEKEGRRIAQGKPYASVHELRLNKRDLRALAAAGALESLAGHRRLARWVAAGAARRDPLDRRPPSACRRLRRPRKARRSWRTMRASVSPSAATRSRCSGPASPREAHHGKRMLRLPHGRPARVSGLVTCRQRPDTASGVVFVTLEDETGCMNIVVWKNLVDGQRAELLHSRLMGVEGVVERDGEVVHLVARRLADYSALLGPLAAASRDFH